MVVTDVAAALPSSPMTVPAPVASASRRGETESATRPPTRTPTVNEARPTEKTLASAVSSAPSS